MASTGSVHEQRIGSCRADGRMLRVLVVEDDPDCAECLALLLQDGGFAVDIAADGASALESVDANLPDVVLLDIGLPDMDGYQVAHRLRHLAAEMPLLIALTGYLEDKLSPHPATACFDYCFLKPVDPDLLLAFLADHAGAPERRSTIQPVSSGLRSIK